MRALLSVYDKTDLAKVAAKLLEEGHELISTGGTYDFLVKEGFPVLKVEEVSGAKEILGGRVKTLHPKIHGGILYRRGNAEDENQLWEEGISPINVIVCNLYPFEEKLKENLSEEEMVEFIDIGGPTMIRAAAKNFRHTLVLSDPVDYQEYLEQGNSLQLRKKMAAVSFNRICHYDLCIAAYLQGNELRYGENPHQKAYFVQDEKGLFSKFDQLHGKELSYINYLDADAAYTIALEFEEICCVGIKHASPCSVALGESAKEAYTKMVSCDPVSIFGGVVALNRIVDEQTATEMVKIMLHMVVAPGFTEEALAILQKKKNLILLQIKGESRQEHMIRSIDGGILLQQRDLSFSQDFQVVTKKAPTLEEMEQLIFALKVVKHAKSNGIVTAENGMAVGIGQGNVNRIDAAKIALSKGGSVLASDAFFPFDDVVTEAAKHGIKAIVQPGGSLRDEDSIKKCDELGIAMVFTGMRHFRH